MLSHSELQWSVTVKFQPSSFMYLLARWLWVPGWELWRVWRTPCGSIYGRPTEGWGYSALRQPVRSPTSTTTRGIQRSCGVTSHDGLWSGAIQNKCGQGVQHLLPLWQCWEGKQRRLKQPILLKFSLRFRKKSWFYFCWYPGEIHEEQTGCCHGGNGRLLCRRPGHLSSKQLFPIQPEA